MKQGAYFDWITWTKADITREVAEVLARKKTAHETIKAVEPTNRTFENTIEALEHAGDSVSDVSQQLQVLMSVHPEMDIRNAAQEANERLEEANVDLDFDRGLWRAVNELPATSFQLSATDKKLHEDIMRDLHRMGFALPDEQFETFKSLRKELQKLEQEFEKAINDYTDHILVTRKQLAGLPERYIEGLERVDGMYAISLRYPDYFPFMELADDDALRKELCEKNFRKGGIANLERLAQMIRLRQRIAKMLGYKSHADFVTEVRMAKTGANVDHFLTDILKKLVPGVHNNLRELVDIKKRIRNLEKPAPVHYYELGYWGHKLLKERFDVDTEKLKEYFPLAHVFSGIMDIYQNLLGLTFHELHDIPTWHPDVKVYEVKDRSSDEHIGHFFLDFHPREGKYGHAAAFPISLGEHRAIALVCNFPKPTPTNPSLLSHDEVETLLHEFGHVMHALVSTSTYQRQNGFGVAMDFIEALSQIFEYWAWDSRSLKLLSKHYATDESLPNDVIQKLVASRMFQKAYYYTRQAVMALYDLKMHSAPIDAPVDPEHLAKRYRDMALQYEHQDLPEDAIRAAGWGHMADYDAGYYGYLWSRVYAADMFTRFSENPFDVVIGTSYRAKVLASGASRPEKQLVEDFLGRPSNADAFLKEIGI